MKAIVYDRYGPPEVLHLEDVEKPTPGDDQVLIKVCAASVNPYEWHFMRGTPYVARMMMGLRRPKNTRLGVDVSGVVDGIGRSVTQFKRGDAVFGACRGSLAEYACATEKQLAAKPANATFEQAAAVPIAGLTALHGLRDVGRLEPGQKVLINGASGGVGTFAVQIAKSLGTHVTAVCSSRNVDMVRSLGADRVVDYTCDDFTKSAERYDVMLDTVGNRPLTACALILKSAGIYAAVGGSPGRWFSPLDRIVAMKLLSPFVRPKMTMVFARSSPGDLNVLRELLGAGKVTPAIDRSYPLAETANAIRYLEQGHARGKVIITVRSG